MKVTKYVIETNGFYLSAFTVAKRRLFKHELRSISMYDFEESDEGYILTFGPSEEFEYIERGVIRKLCTLINKTAAICNYEGVPTYIRLVSIERLKQEPTKQQLVTNQTPEHVSITNLHLITGASR